MKIRAVFTDLDGTLLESDGSLHPDVLRMLSHLDSQGIRVCPVTSKTPAELDALRSQFELRGPFGFENGAGVMLGDGSIELSLAAVPVPELRVVLDELRALTGIHIRSAEELSDEELASITGLAGDLIPRVRFRSATLPLVVDPAYDEALRRVLPCDPPARLIRGNRFLHLQGKHDKADVVDQLLRHFGETEGRIVACGDAPNDAGLLARADIAVIVPSAQGPNETLLNLFPHARIAPKPHGRGWAIVISALLEEDE
jgi:mannosyl-3-phosphoglycerate phosphatase